MTLKQASEQLPYLKVECTHCDRQGRYKFAGLIEEHGEDFTLPELAKKLSEGCDKHQWAYANCAVYFSDLPMVYSIG